MKNVPLACFIALFALVVYAPAQNRSRLRPLPPASKDARTGPAVGEKIPAFEAVDQNGVRQSFETLRGPKGLMLVFSRSADWCPYCKAQLADVNRQLDQLRRQGLNVASVTYDSADILKDFAQRKSIRYPMLSDPDSKIIRAFGIFNTNIEVGTRGYGIPFPGIYIVDASGAVKSKYFEDDYRERYTASSVLSKEFGVTGTEVSKLEAPQLTLIAWAADQNVAPGARTTLVVELELKPQMHVYAPGVKSEYIPIEWKMAGGQTYLPLETKFPAPHTQYFPAMKESVPVYTKRVRLERDVVVGQEGEIAALLQPGRTLEMQSEFSYQVCDEKKCFPPRTVPLKWTLHVNSPDTERVPEPIRKEK